MIAGGLRALRPFDLKQLLAFGTISQLGFLMVLFGIGQPEATAAGCALLLAHGLFKAALFMVVGHRRPRDATPATSAGLPRSAQGGGRRRSSPSSSAASMAAIPPLAGFIAKEAAYDALRRRHRPATGVVLVGHRRRLDAHRRLQPALRRCGCVRPAASPQRRPSATGGRPRAPGSAFVAARRACSPAASVVLGVAPALWIRLVDAAANALDPRGARPPRAVARCQRRRCVLSVADARGRRSLLFGARRPGRRVQSRLRAAGHRRRGLRGDGPWRARSSRRASPASCSPGRCRSTPRSSWSPPRSRRRSRCCPGTWWPGWPELVGQPPTCPIAALLIGGAVAATVARRRFAAALLLGVVGYGMALLFVVQGAPDLALTQFAIETLSVVVFVLVLRRLPDRFERRAARDRSRRCRLAVSAAVGVFVLVMAIAAAGARTDAPVSRGDVRAGAARRRRQQRRQRDPRRLPRPRHAGRDHGARRRRHRHRGAGAVGPRAASGGRRRDRRTDAPSTEVRHDPTRR